MKKFWKRVRSLFGSAEGRAGRQGFVERVDPQEVSGWLMWSGDEPPKLQLLCGGMRFSVDTVWHERQDVAAEFPQAPLRCGFCFPLPAEARSMVARKASNAKKLRVLADGVPVRIVGNHVINVPLLYAGETSLEREDARRVTLFAEKNISVDGCVIDVAVATASSLRLVATISGKSLDGKPLPALEIDLVCQQQKLRPFRVVEPSRESRELVFELPGYWWSLASATQGMPLQLALGEQRLPAASFAVSLAWGRECLQRIARRRGGNTHDQLLALEHAHFLQPFGRLNAAVLSWLHSVAKDFHIGDYLSAASAGDAQEQKPDQSRQQLIDALREINRQMPAWRGREQELVRTIAHTLPDERQRESLRETLLPWFCREGRLSDARALFSAAHIKRLSRAASAWQASLALPFLVTDGEIEKAAAVLRALPGLQGWVVTECIAEASRHVLTLQGNSPDTENFGAALLILMEKWSADYWSRKEDVELIACCVSWLVALPRFSHRFRNDLYLAALRIYGLSPVFWARLLPLLDGEDVLHVRLAAAGERFQRLELAVRALSSSQPVASALHDDLAYFRRAGCHDAARFARELVAAEIVGFASAESGTVAGSLLLDDMLALGETEIVRVAAYPTDKPLLSATESAALPGCVLDLQRNVPRSAHAALQRSLAGRLRLLSSASGLDVGRFLADLEALRSDACCYLSVDILAAGLLLSTDAETAALLATSLVSHLDEIMATPVPELPAQPVLAAMARMGQASHLPRIAELDAAVRSMKRWLGEQQPGATAARVVLPGAAATGIESDVLVVVYSCRRYLDSRIAAIRESWLKDLQARGIPYVIVVGDGDNTLDGDVLQLAVPDRYEDLPAKTLAIVRWAHANTTCEFLLKIDDDCLLNVPAFFDDLVYRQFHYYGRVLRRGKGGIDRRWHQQRSQGEPARHMLEKSPEPSSYADGGGGYCLSRHAMTKMLAAAESPAGVRLISSSFLEDKVVGDLLAMSGIAGRSDEYHTVVRRRFGAGSEPVNVFENTFFPSPCYPAKLAHLDSPAHMSVAWRHLQETALWPKKLWPSQGLPSLDFGKSNQLELLTPLAQVRALNREDLFVVAAMRNEKLMLPHFLRHYRAMGVRAFLVIDNLSDDGTREMLLAEPDVVLYSTDTEYRHSQFGVAWQQTVLAAHCLNKWALIADADELLVCPGGMDLPSYTAMLSAGGYDAARILMVDMYPAGDLAAADFASMDPFCAAPWFDAAAVVSWHLGSGAYNNAGNYVSGLRHRLMPAAEPNAFPVQKYPLVQYAPWMRFCGGLHNVANARVAKETAWFAHFKYHAGFKARVDQEVARQQHFGLAQEYQSYQSLLANGGGFDVPGISTRYSSPTDFMQIIVGDDASRP